MICVAPTVFMVPLEGMTQSPTGQVSEGLPRTWPCVLQVLTQNKLVVANLGDSRCVLGEFRTTAIDARLFLGTCSTMPVLTSC
jgi:hypothetical protein